MRKWIQPSSLWEILSIYLEGNRQCVDFLENQSVKQQQNDERKKKKEEDDENKIKKKTPTNQLRKQSFSDFLTCG